MGNKINLKIFYLQLQGVQSTILFAINSVNN